MINSTRSIGPRVTRVVRLNFLNPWLTLVVPWLLLAAIMLASYLIEEILKAPGIDTVSTSFSHEFILIIYLLVHTRQLLYQQFSLALSYGLSRRDFYLGVLTSYGIIALLAATGSALIALVQGTLQIVEPSAIGEYLALTFWAYLAVQVSGAAITAIYMRWQGIGLFTFFAAMTVLVISLSLAFGRYGLSDVRDRFLFSTDFSTTRVLVQLGFLLIVALSGYVFIRKAKP